MGPAPAGHAPSPVGRRCSRRRYAVGGTPGIRGIDGDDHSVARRSSPHAARISRRRGHPAPGTAGRQDRLMTSGGSAATAAPALGASRAAGRPRCRSGAHPTRGDIADAATIKAGGGRPPPLPVLQGPRVRQYSGAPAVRTHASPPRRRSRCPSAPGGGDRRQAGLQLISDSLGGAAAAAGCRCPPVVGVVVDAAARCSGCGINATRDVAMVWSVRQPDRQASRNLRSPAHSRRAERPGQGGGRTPPHRCQVRPVVVCAATTMLWVVRGCWADPPHPPAPGAADGVPATAARRPAGGAELVPHRRRTRRE